MKHIARTVKQVAAAVRRERRIQSLTQSDLGNKVQVRQATISRLENGKDGILLQTLLDTLGALNLEIVIQPRTKTSSQDIEEMFK